MARGDTAFRAVSATLFGVSVLAGTWLATTMVAGFRAAGDHDKSAAGTGAADQGAARG